MTSNHDSAPPSFGLPSRRAGILALTMLSATAALIAGRVAGPGGPWLWYYDLPKIFWPNAVLWHQAATSGGIPMWIDRLGLGYPVYAEGQIGSFYPPNWFIFHLEPLTALDVTRVLHLTMAGVGAGLIALRLSGTWSGATLAALVAVLGGAIVAKLEWTSVVTAYAWAPWVLLPLFRRPRPSRAGIAIAGVAWGIQALAGHPDTWVLTGVCAATILLAARPGVAAVGRIVAFGLIGVGVGAVQLLPTLTLLGLSVRSGGLSSPDLFSNSATVLDPLLAAFANVFVPGGPGGWDLGRIWYPGGVYGIHEAAAYVGLPVLALAGIGLFARRSRPLLAVVAVMIAIAAIGAFQPQWWASLPILDGLRHPVRAYMLASLVVGPLAAIGLTRLRHRTRAWRPAAFTVGGFAVAYAALVAFVLGFPGAFESFTVSALGAAAAAAPGIRANAAFALTRPFPVLVELAAGCLSVVVIAVVSGRSPAASRVARAAGPTLVVMAMLPLAAFSPMANPVADRDAFDFGARPLMAAVIEAAPRRFLADADPIFYDALPNQPAAHGISDLGMSSSLNLAATDTVWQAARDGPGVDPTLAAALGIDVVATFGGETCPGVVIARVQPNVATVCRLASATRPPLWLAAAAVPGVDPPAPPSGPIDTVLAAWEPAPVDVKLAPTALLADGQQVDVLERTDSSLDLVVNAPQAGWVWIDRAWWPDWQTTVDGTVVPVLRALGGQLVSLTPGRHEIRQSFVPLDVLVGLLIGLLALFTAVAWVLLGDRRGLGRRFHLSEDLPAWVRGRARKRTCWPLRGGPSGPSGPHLTKAPPGHFRVSTASFWLVKNLRRHGDEANLESPDTASSPAREVVRSDVPTKRTTPGIPAGRVPGLVMLGVILFALAWLAPPLAIVVVWPFLFVIPGWILVARVAPRLGPAGRLGVGIVTSTYVAAHLANLLGDVVGGFDRPIAVATAALLAGASLVLAVLPLPGLAPPPSLDLRDAVGAIRRRRTPFLLAASASVGIGGILVASAWHEIAGGWVSGGWNWSDFLVHVSIGQSIVEGNFPPQVPYFAGVPLTYHWFADFHGAIAASAAGLHVIPVFIVSSGILAGSLALVVWELALHLMGNRRAATIATILVFLAGGMGWLRLVTDVASGAGGTLELIRAQAYDNSWGSGWPYFKIASILGTGLTTHRATTFGLPGVLSVLLLVRVSLGRRPAGIALAGTLAALLAPFQFYFFPATYLLVGLYAVGSRVWHRRGWLRDATIFLAPVVLALPFVIGPVLLQQDRGSIHFVLGWSEAPLGDGLGAVIFFYATNLGLPLLLGALALLVSRPPGRIFLAAWAVAMFLVPNVVVAGAVVFDMNKYFQLMAVALALLGGWLLRRRRTVVVATVIAATAISPILVTAWQVASTSVALTTGQERAAVWIEANTPQRAVFLTDAFINSPVDYAGRLRITTFGPYAANLGYDPAPREADIHVAYCNGPEAAAEVMSHYGATYVLSSGGALDCAGSAPTDFAASPRFETVYDTDGVTIWHLRG